MSVVKSHKVECGSLPLQRVVVFNDRAEIKREFPLVLEKGLNEIEIENVSGSMNDDSVRVTGKGSAVIEEVQVKDRRSIAGEGDNSRVATLREAVENAKNAVAALNDKKNVLSFRLKALDDCCSTLGHGAVRGKDQNQAFNVSDESLQSISTLFSFHEKESLQTRNALHAVGKEVEAATNRLRAAENELGKAEQGQYVRVLSVLLECAEGGEVVLSLSYQTWGASWNPFYDIRVDTQNEKALHLTYQANVQQSTGEDWEGGQLVLSTAQPCLGGTIPELGTLDVSFYRPPPPQPVQAYGYGGGPQMMMKRGMARSGGAAPETAMLFGAAPCAADIVPVTAMVSEQSLSTEFLISRPANIPSDGSFHKVTMGVVTLRPQLIHETVPSRSAAAFLTASCINSSSLALLAGPASVYLDGAFVAKTHLKAVSPGERFTSSLGVDPAVKIEYKPAHRFNNETGMINKWSSLVHEQKIVVKNTKSDSVLLTIREHIPRSTDEKIKLKILSPEQVERPCEESVDGEGKARSPGARLRPSSHNLEWTVLVEKGVTLPLSVKWQLDHPHNEKITFAEKF